MMVYDGNNKERMKLMTQKEEVTKKQGPWKDEKAWDTEQRQGLAFEAEKHLLQPERRLF